MSSGANGGKAPKGTARELGFNAMFDNASQNVASPGGTVKVTEDLVSAINPSSDTTMMEMYDGTVTSGGANGSG